MRDPDPQKLLSLVRLIDDEWTDALCQNSDVMNGARQAKQAASKLAESLGPEHPGFSSAWLAFTSSQEILKAEEAEDLRQKGISGLWDRLKPDLIHILKAYAASQQAAREEN